MIPKCWSALRLSFQTSLPFRKNSPLPFAKLTNYYSSYMLLAFLIPCFGPNFSFCLQYHVTSHSLFSAFLNSICSLRPFLDICHFSLKIILLLKIICSPSYSILFVLFLCQGLPPFIIKTSISFLKYKKGKIKNMK